MASHLIKKLAIANGAILVLSVLLSVFLCSVGSDNQSRILELQKELGAIRLASNITEGYSHAERMYTIAGGWGHITASLSLQVLFVLLVLTPLSLLILSFSGS